MQYYSLGGTGLKISRLCLGAMTFGEEWGWGTDDRVGRGIFDAFIEAGGNFIDTADMYTEGHSERALGQFIAAGKTRDKCVVSSKFTFGAKSGDPNSGGNGRKNIMRALEGSLQRLDTDYIDLYLLHAFDGVTPVEEVVRTMDDLIRSGKIRHYGFSNVPAWYAARAEAMARHGGYESPCALQMQYSLLERNIEHEYIDLATGYGMGIMCWSPLASGLLTGKYRADGPELAGEGRLKILEGSNHPALERLNERNWSIVAELVKIAAELDRAPAQMALNWIANRPGVATVVIGATSREQLLENIAALDFAMPEAHSRKLEQISRPAAIYPYGMIGKVRDMMTGGVVVAAKPDGYFPRRAAVES